MKTRKRVSKKTAAARKAKREAMAAWAAQVKQRDHGACVVCGLVSAGDKGRCRIQAHHVLEKKAWPRYATTLLNGLTLCPRHHCFGKRSAHTNPVWWSWWLSINRPEVYSWALARMGEDDPDIDPKIIEKLFGIL